jgi:lipoate-protein ligase A
MRMRVIDCGYVSASLSQAIWYGVAAQMRPEGEPALTLVNSLDPYVCIGLHQDARLEVDADYCGRAGVAILRRRLGGGAVYLDENQLIFHFVLPRRRAPERASKLYPVFIEPVLRTYRDLGIDATYRPVNDIHVDGRKIGGTAAAVLDQATVLGGMFLFDFDTKTMAHCLKVPSEKFRDKLHKTLDEYVTSMRRLLPEVPSRETVKSIFLRHVADCLDIAPHESTTTEIEGAAIAAEALQLTDPNWVWQVGRRFVTQGVKVTAETYLSEGAYKAPGGLIRVQLLERSGHVVDIEITGDFTCNPSSGVVGLAARLKGESLSRPHLDDTIADAIASLHLDLPGVDARHIAAAIEASRPREFH